MALTMDRQMMDPHAYTALPIAAARAVAHDRSGEWISDPLAKKLVAGENHLISAGSNVEYMTKRKLIGDELVLEQHWYGTRQVVSLGAGMDSRAFRLGLNDSTFFEVDKQGLFDVKEPLVSDVPLQCAARRTVVGTIGSMNLAACLRNAGFDSSQPTTWLMEGLLPYLTVPIMKALASDISALSAPGSALWADGFSKTSVDGGMSFHGVPFESGFDNYDEIFRNVGFETSEVIDFAGISLDKHAGRVHIDKRYVLTPQQTHGRPTCLMVRAYKSLSTW
jgi:methyltransferase (TIGR00027 family)